MSKLDDAIADFRNACSAASGGSTTDKAIKHLAEGLIDLAEALKKAHEEPDSAHIPIGQ